MGLPGLVIILAQNQRSVGESLDQEQIAVNLGWHGLLSPLKITEHITQLLLSLETRNLMASKGQSLVDGAGTDRVLIFFQKKKFRLRRACQEDYRLFWSWVNDPGVRQSAFSKAYIPLEENHSWFFRKIQDPNCIIFIALDESDCPIGQVRFDIKEAGEAEIDVSIDKAQRGLGFGGAIIDAATEEIFKNTSVKEVNAFVKPDNIPSLKAFERAKYNPTGLADLEKEKAVHLKRRSNND